MDETNSQRFLIDGFPRSQDNMEGWERDMNDSAIVDSVILLECPDEICTERILKRSLTSGRSDDNIKTLEKRFKTFQSETLPVINYMDKSHSYVNAKRNLVNRINSNNAISEAYVKVKEVIAQAIGEEVLELYYQQLKACDDNDKESYDRLLAADYHSVASISQLSNIQQMSQDAQEFWKYSIWGDFCASPMTDAYNEQSYIMAKKSSLSRPHVRVIGKSVVISSVRLLQMKLNLVKYQSLNRGTDELKRIGSVHGDFMTVSCEETRVFQLIEGQGRNHWKNIHLHRVIL
jgi:hypothetical protein